MAGSVEEHLKSLAKYPPVQGGASFDMSTVVEDFVKHLQHLQQWRFTGRDGVVRN